MLCGDDAVPTHPLLAYAQRVLWADQTVDVDIDDLGDVHHFGRSQIVIRLVDIEHVDIFIMHCCSSQPRRAPCHKMQHLSTTQHCSAWSPDVWCFGTHGCLEQALWSRSHKCAVSKTYAGSLRGRGGEARDECRVVDMPCPYGGACSWTMTTACACWRYCRGRCQHRTTQSAPCEIATEGVHDQEVDEVAATPTAHLVKPKEPRGMFSFMVDPVGLLVVEQHVLDRVLKNVG